MKLRKETRYKVQIYHETAGWVFLNNGGYDIQFGNIADAKKEKMKVESSYQCKARIVKVTHWEEIFKEKVKS